MTLPVVVVGAGPYGLSISAHLTATGVDHRIIGRPMATWAERMPRGMFLKSEGFASSLSDPAGEFTLEAFCRETDRDYAPVGYPVPLDTFTAYGRTFQERLVPSLEPNDVVDLRRGDRGWVVRLDDGRSIRAHMVVLAVGIDSFAHIPRTLARAAGPRVRLVSDYPDLSVLAGERVTLVGGGQSALGAAALLCEAGADVRVLVRADRVVWNTPPRPAKGYERVRSPICGLGAGWKLTACSDAPDLFRLLPRGQRQRLLRSLLGPSGAWWLDGRMEGVRIDTGTLVADVEVGDREVRVHTAGPAGLQSFRTDRLLLATGYRVDLHRLRFLGPEVLARVRTAHGYPLLSSTFETSAPGLHMVGLPAALTFGPAQRFVWGAGVASRRISGQAVAVRRPSTAPWRHARRAAEATVEPR